MKKHIFIFSFCLASVFTLSAQDRCDTLKWKVTNTEYNKINPPSVQFFGNLHGAVINLDTLYSFTPFLYYTNISRDTFLQFTELSVLSNCAAYTDTGRFDFDFSFSLTFRIYDQINPGGESNVGFGEEFNFSNMISTLKMYGLSFEEITHWEMINMIIGTSIDGLYSDSVVSLGADTSIFYITRTPPTPPSIQETTQTEFFVFPNPAQSQFTVTNTENAKLSLYNILGQQVKQVIGEGENTIIYTEDLPQGIYILKIEKGDAVLTKKVQISK